MKGAILFRERQYNTANCKVLPCRHAGSLDISYAVLLCPFRGFYSPFVLVVCFSDSFWLFTSVQRYSAVFNGIMVI